MGLVLIAAAWSLSWFGDGFARHLTFFPLWFGYILTVDAVCLLTSGTSLMHRLGKRTGWLFLISIPLWWFFELVNARLENWVYVLPHRYGWLAYHLEATLAFSTVVPAVLVTAEVVRLHLIRSEITWLRVAPSNRGLVALILTGAGMLAITIIWPAIFFPLTWISMFLICDPLVALVGGRSVSSQVREGRWDTVLVLFVATLICGFFWEMWNVRAMPKWEYTIPYANWLHVFEMPVLGFGGYLPFGLEIYAFVHLVDRLFGLGLSSAFRFDRTPPES